MALSPEQTKTLEEVGRCALSSILEMVAALECDYDRLEELRDAKSDWDTEENDGKAWAEANEDDAAELAELEEARGEHEDRESAEQAIHEDPLSLQFRSGWCSSKDEMEPEEYELLLGTGGPAVRIVGEIDGGEAHSARLEVQDWFTPWVEHITTGSDHEALMTYVRCFYFGA
jgi:hypothetical protein